MNLSGVMNTIVDGVEPEYDWSGIKFEVDIDVLDPETGELDIRFDIDGLPEITLQVGDVCFEYHDGWEVTEWGGDISQNDCVEQCGRYYYADEHGGDDDEDIRAIDALPNLLNQYWSNPYSRSMKLEDVDEDQIGTVEYAIGRTDYTKFYDICGVYYGKKASDAEIPGRKPMDASAFARHLIKAKLLGKI